MASVLWFRNDALRFGNILGVESSRLQLHRYDRALPRMIYILMTRNGLFRFHLLLSVDRSGSRWITCNVQLPSPAFCRIRQEQMAVY